MKARPRTVPTGLPPLSLATILAASLFPATVTAEDWPRFRGPAGDGTVSASEAAKAPDDWSDSKNIAWRTELPGAGSSSPVVAGNKVFLTCYSGYGVDDADPGDVAGLRRHAVCLDLESGEIIWSHEAEPAGPQTVYEGRYITTHGYASSSAVTDGRGVYFFLGDSGVFAFTLEGKLVWQGSVGQDSHDWGSGASPILWDDLLIVNGASESDSVVAFDKKTGKEVWTYQGVPRAWNTPTIVEAADGKPVMLLATQRFILGIDPRTGQELWRVPGIRAAELCPSILVEDGVAYVIGSPKGEGMALRLGGRGEVDESAVLWRIQKGSNVSSPVFKDGHLYFANDARGVLYCVDAEDGEILYEERLPGRGEKVYASPLLIGDHLYYLSRSGVTYVGAAKPEFELLKTNTLSGDGGVFNASPALVDGKLLIRSDKVLYCIEE